MAKRKSKQRTTALARRQAAAPTPDSPGVLGVFERLARDRALTVDKLGSLIALQEHIQEVEAKAAFEDAYARMQPGIPIISKRGRILNKEKQVQSHYAKYEDIRKIVDPILRAHGFHMHFRTEWPETGVLEVVSILTHSRGHSRESRFRSAADASGGKNAIQGLGSADSYGKRYGPINLLNIVCEGQDDDGRAAGHAPPPRRQAPPTQTAPASPPAGRPAAPQEPPAAHPAKEGEPITDGQRKRLWASVKSSGRSQEEIRVWLSARFGWDSTNQIKRSVYDYVVRCVEATGILPEA